MKNYSDDTYVKITREIQLIRKVKYVINVIKQLTLVKNIL